MTSRVLGLIALGSAVPLLGMHWALKRQVKPEDVAHLTRFVSRPTQWQGRVAPSFELPTLEGETFRLADHVGREVVVLNFFATWCGPCREEMPELARFHAKNASRPVRLVAIDDEEKKDLVAAFVERLEIPFAVLLDEPGNVVEAYGASSLPTTVVIGADGRILLYQTGAIRNADVTLEPVLAPELLRLERGEGISREAYLEAARTERYPSATPAPPESAGLQGRALEIARKMDCPCGCDDKVGECGCKTAKSIKTRLASSALEGRADEDVIRELNKEFCMGGM
jgi:peroxiredoxin